jgi:hypothetical protein
MAGTLFKTVRSGPSPAKTKPLIFHFSSNVAQNNRSTAMADI